MTPQNQNPAPVVQPTPTSTRHIRIAILTGTALFLVVILIVAAFSLFGGSISNGAVSTLLGMLSVGAVLIILGTLLFWSAMRANRNRQEGQSTHTSAETPPKKKLSKKWVILLVLLVCWLAIGIGRNIWNIESKAKSALPASYEPNRWCGAEKEAINLFDKNIPGKRFTYRTAEGCFAELVLPKFSHNWHLQTLKPQKPGDWVAIACADGRVIVPPQAPNSGARFDCNGSDDRDKNTFLFQGNVELSFIAQ
jgi:uncharacterized membrane protein YhaH (DUF805 family)